MGSVILWWRFQDTHYRNDPQNYDLYSSLVDTSLGQFAQPCNVTFFSCPMKWRRSATCNVLRVITNHAWQAQVKHFANLELNCKTALFQLYDQRDVDDRMLKRLESCAALPAHPNVCGICSHFPCRVPRSLLDPNSRGGAADALCVVISSRPLQSLQVVMCSAWQNSSSDIFCSGLRSLFLANNQRWCKDLFIATRAHLANPFILHKLSNHQKTFIILVSSVFCTFWDSLFGAMGCFRVFGAETEAQLSCSEFL